MKVIYLIALEVNNETQYAQDDHILDCRGVAVIGVILYVLKFHQTVAFLLELVAFLVLCGRPTCLAACKIQREVQAGNWSAPQCCGLYLILS